MRSQWKDVVAKLAATSTTVSTATMQNLIRSLLTQKPSHISQRPLLSLSWNIHFNCYLLHRSYQSELDQYDWCSCQRHKRMNLFTFFTFVASFDISAITLSILMTASMVWCLNSLSYIGSDWPFQKFIFLCFSFYCNVSKYRPKSFATLVTSRLYDCKSHVVVDLFNWFDPQALSKNNWLKRKWIDRWRNWHRHCEGSKQVRPNMQQLAFGGEFWQLLLTDSYKQHDVRSWNSFWFFCVIWKVPLQI